MNNCQRTITVDQIDALIATLDNHRFGGDQGEYNNEDVIAAVDLLKNIRNQQPSQPS